MSAVSLSAVKVDDTPRETLRVIAGEPDPAQAGTGALAVGEDAQGHLHLVKVRAARAKTDTRDARPAAYVRTSKLADFAKAISTGLVTE